MSETAEAGIFRPMVGRTKRVVPTIAALSLVIDVVLLALDYFTTDDPTLWTEAVGGFFVPFLVLLSAFVVLSLALEERNGSNPEGDDAS